MQTQKKNLGRFFCVLNNSLKSKLRLRRTLQQKRIIGTFKIKL